MCYSVLFSLYLSYSILFYLILSYSILFYLILSYVIFYYIVTHHNIFCTTLSSYNCHLLVTSAINKKNKNQGMIRYLYSPFLKSSHPTIPPSTSLPYLLLLFLSLLLFLFLLLILLLLTSSYSYNTIQCRYHNGNDEDKEGMIRGFGHTGFLCDDLDTACDYMMQKGVIFKKKPSEGAMRGTCSTVQYGTIQYIIVQYGTIQNNTNTTQHHATENNFHFISISISFSIPSIFS